MTLPARHAPGLPSNTHRVAAEYSPVMTGTQTFHLNSSQSNTKVVGPYFFGIPQHYELEFLFCMRPPLLHVKTRNAELKYGLARSGTINQLPITHDPNVPVTYRYSITERVK